MTRQRNSRVHQGSFPRFKVLAGEFIVIFDIFRLEAVVFRAVAKEAKKRASDLSGQFRKVHMKERKEITPVPWRKWGSCDGNRWPSRMWRAFLIALFKDIFGSIFNAAQGSEDYHDDDFFHILQYTCSSRENAGPAFSYWSVRFGEEINKILSGKGPVSLCITG